MGPLEPPDLGFIKALSFIAIAAVGGALGHMMRKLKAKEPIAWGELAIQSSSAGFAGLLVLLACRVAKVPDDAIGVVTGLAGWLGAEMSLGLLESIVRRRLNLDGKKDETK